MRSPSVKTLAVVFGSRASEAKELILKTRKTRDYASVTELERSAFNRIGYHDRLMCALDEIAGTFGVESITPRNADFRDSPDYEYLNTGDTYAATLIYSFKTGAFRVGSWGDIVERSGSRYA